MRKIIYFFLPALGMLVFSCKKSQEPFSVQLLERKTLGGNQTEGASGIVATADGGHVVIGSTLSNNSGEVRTNHGSMDYWVARLNSKHDTLWTRVLGGANSDFAQAVAATPDGGFVVAGYTSSAGSGQVPQGYGSMDFWLVKLTGNGNVAWSRIYGGIANDEAFGVTVTNDGTIYVAGVTAGSIIANNVGVFRGDHDMLVMKLTASGDLVWSRTMGGEDYDAAFAITATSNGVVVVGTTESGNSGDVTGTYRGGNGDVWAARLNSEGGIVWSKLLGGTGYEQLRAVATSSDGGFIAVGYTNSNHSYDIDPVNNGGYDCLLLKLKDNGDTEWMRLVGGSENDYAYAVAGASGGKSIIAGYSRSNNGDIGSNKGNADAFLAGFDINGQKTWSTAFGSAEVDYCYGLAIKPNGIITAAGSTQGSNNGDVNTASHGVEDWWIVNVKAK